MLTGYVDRQTVSAEPGDSGRGPANDVPCDDPSEELSYEHVFGSLYWPRKQRLLVFQHDSARNA